MSINFLKTILDSLAIEMIKCYYFSIDIDFLEIQTDDILIHQNLLIKYSTNYQIDLINFLIQLKKINYFYFENIFNQQPNSYSYFKIDDLYIILVTLFLKAFIEQHS